MNILIINTAFEVADYIVLKNDEVYSFKTDSNAKHSETSLVYIDKALQGAGIGINDIDAVAVNLGAGSFTGIRIGVAIAKGFLSANNNLKAIGFNSFEPLLNRLKSGSGKILISTGKSDYYTCEVKDYKIINMKCEVLQENDTSEEICIFDNIYNENELIDLVKEKAKSGIFSDNNELEPVYLKLSQAEEELLKKTK
ncbi:MAG: tRNA (adenosine(37)-N6)-threonylcarbamoyltransferase complex dimerization subunit type 1 TsaB [Clostridia bacterium]|nr:tRNA (adenosine(37)-N6)-threonylcarbamoyltransferase complex dimerization subunit type 1 TsaB [Clostridia bacterium]MBQ9793264.1 tRNA (adenosine(37)-N6)-threonylcarbamoyltransferase complex dimerization subunit type 1 TsaB [Clostridia bacterium]